MNYERELSAGYENTEQGLHLAQEKLRVRRETAEVKRQESWRKTNIFLLLLMLMLLMKMMAIIITAGVYFQGTVSNVISLDLGSSQMPSHINTDVLHMTFF